MESKNKKNTAILPSTVETRTDRSALSVPRPEDGIDEDITKLTAPNRRSNPEMLAVSQMSPQESEAWTAFKGGHCRLPEIDWDNNHLPSHNSLKSRKTARRRRRAEALNRLYKTDRAHEGHVTWITQNKIWFLPLIKAMARFIGAEINQTGGEEWHATQLSDLQSANRILSTSTQICQGSKSTVPRSTWTETQHVLGNYRRTLQVSRLKMSAQIIATEEGTNESTKRECNSSHGRMLRQNGVEKVFPRCHQLRLHRLKKCVVFDCNRCGQQKKAKLVAFAQDQSDKPVCNGCYGYLRSINRTK